MRGVRKLAAVCVGYSAAVFIAHYLLSSEKLIAAAVICLLVGFSGFAFSKNTRKRIMLLLFAAAVGFAGYKYHYEATVTPAEAMADSKVTVKAIVTDFPEERKNCRMLYVRFCDEKLPKNDGVLFDYSGSTAELRPGDEIEAEVKLRSAVERYNEETDLNISKGLYVVGYINGECNVTGHENKLKYLPKYLGNTLRDKINEIFPEDASPFMLALLTGDKSEYYGDDKLSTSMSISGLAHVVAVSGMHVAFLVGFLQMVMGRNRRSSLVCIALIWAFVIMVGAPPSSVRAAVMQTMLLTAYLFMRENDNITTLSFAMALILAFNPFACGSISLQLSFAAMAGILIFTQPVYNWLAENVFTAKGRLRRLCTYVSGAIAGSLAATVFTVPIIAINFGYVSVLSMLANILCLWCISLLFCGGYVICAIGFILPSAAKVLAGIISCLVRYIALVVKWIAKIPIAAVYVENKLVWVWLAVTYAAFALYIIFKRRKKISAFVPIGITVLGFAALLLSMKAAMLNDNGTIAVMDVGNGQSIALTSHENSVVIDCGSGGIAENPGFIMSGYLHANGRSSIDYLVLTHLHTDHAKGVCRLMNSITVKNLILPADAEKDNGLLDEIIAAAEENGVNIILINNDRDISCGDINLNIYLLESNEHSLIISAEIKDYTVLVTGDAEMKAERELVEKKDLSDTDLYVVGHHGSKYSSSEELLNEAMPETAVISVGNNSYGHPTQEVLDRLCAVDAEIYRTDIDGRFVLRLD